MPGIAIFVLVAYGFSIGWNRLVILLEVGESKPQAKPRRCICGIRKKMIRGLGGMAGFGVGISHGRAKSRQQEAKHDGVYEYLIFLIQIQTAIGNVQAECIIEQRMSVERCQQCAQQMPSSVK